MFLSVLSVRRQFFVVCADAGLRILLDQIFFKNYGKLFFIVAQLPLFYFFQKYFGSINNMTESISVQLGSTEISCDNYNSIGQIFPLQFSQNTLPCTRFSIIIFSLKNSSLWGNYPVCVGVMRRFSKIFVFQMCFEPRFNLLFISYSPSGKSVF